MAYPRVVALDLDGTVWSKWLNQQRFGHKGWVGHALEDNLEIDGRKIRDKRNQSTYVRVTKDIPKIIRRLVRHNVQIAIVSRNTHKGLCNRAMWLIRIRDPWTKRTGHLTDYITYSEIADTSKRHHFDRIKAWSGADFHQMLLFDDKPGNSDVELWQGVTFHLVSDRSGLSLDDFSRGLDTWRRYQGIRRSMPAAGPNPLLNMRHIGYVGTGRANAKRYQQGMRRLEEPGRPARWGYGMYVADDPEVAAVFAEWGREGDLADQWVCLVYVRDYEEFKKMDKVWVPEHGTIPRTNNLHNTEEHIAKVQIHRDELITDTFNVEKPYILFSKHHWMDIMLRTRLEPGTRVNEMVVYPQVQDALFYGRPTPIGEALRNIASRRYPVFHYHHRLADWNIDSSHETREELRSYGEGFR